jgi:hypothetical protein
MHGGTTVSDSENQHSDSERAGLNPQLRARGHPGPHVTGLRIVALVVAAMDHLFRPVLEFTRQVPKPTGLTFAIFFFIFTVLNVW